MATNLNSFSLAGNLTADPTVRTDANGNTRNVLFTLAVNKGKDKVDFIPVQLSGPQYTEHMRQKLVKGAGVILNGRVENTSYQDKNGNSKTFFAVNPSYCIVGPRGSVNNGTVYGNLTRDPEMRQTPSGKAVANFTVACNRSYRDKNGAWQDAPTSFLSVIAWETQAEFICKYFHKGDPILLSGSLQSRQYTTKEGENRTAYEIVASHVSFAGEKKKDDGTQATAQPQPQQNAGFGGYSAEDFEAIEDNSDLPF